ncbi:Phosphatidylinositol 4-kinase pik1alpha (PI4-kinase)(PtdIns-4-kinase) [Coemansia javaensis]|uniref:1-phosphatidylinositol 4-kinase n=1 Tax=Coemansia javaensis TaxID=2761396 RepID=A0A9W8HKR1_9FUNG|nr:Phosphatidylinositol 4-kinase pik1alpha (PI4-kinase)(PtdIns-4-kinase) [Coemansia javaensis]
MAQDPSSPRVAGGDGGDGSGGAAADRAQPRRGSARNSSLLLRLFTSQFFDTWLAVSYIFRYPRLVGVQHYLCNELRRFPRAEVEFFLPQLVHLLVTRPNESAALESLLMDMSLQSAHVATILYWYLQAYLADLAHNPRTTNFKHCQRIFNQVQELLFTDIPPELLVDAPEPAQHAYLHAAERVRRSASRARPLDTVAERLRAVFRLAPQVRENSQAALVGIASAMSAAGAPSLASAMGWVAVAEAQCAKLPENAADDPEMLLHPRSLAGRARGTNSPARSVSGTRNRPVSYAGVPDRPEAAAAAAAAAPAPADAPRQRPATGHARTPVHERENGSLGDQRSVPAPKPGPSNLDLALATQASALFGHAQGIASAREPGAGADGPVSGVEGVPPRHGGARRGAVGSRSPTPAQRSSTESCRTVAIMEGLEPAPPPRAEPMSAGYTGPGTTSMESCRSYIDRASRQFRRSARQIDRRMSRSSRDPQSPPLTAAGNSIHLPSPPPGHSDAGDGCFAGASEAVRATLDGMAEHVERERTKLERRSGYFGAEIRFITALMDISQRVCAVPKAGRQQFLKAELTLFNHALDKSACIPLWCPDSDGTRHHRIVRIPTEDTVVLNSAERAPYLLTLEVLGPDEHGSSDGREPPAAPAAEPTLPAPITTSARKPTAPARPGTSRASSSGDGPESTGDPRSQPISPAAVEDVDERLITEVFGDIDDVSDIPDSPRSPEGSWHSPTGRPGGQRRGAAAHGTSPGTLAVAVPAAQERVAARVPTSQEDIRARMRTASILLAQLARQQKALGIRVANLVVAQPGGAGDGDAAEAVRRRSKLGNATTQALVLEEIREKLVREMMQLEELRLKQPGLGSAPGSAQDAGGQDVGDSISMHEVEFKDDPSARVLKEDWESKKARIRRTSPYGRQKNWGLLSVIVKEGADLRQEQLAVQLIREMQRIWQREATDVFVQYYRIMVAGEGCGLMETITNTVSVHSIKKEFYSRNPGYSGPPYTLYNYFITSYGTPDTQRFRDAQDCFMRSLAAYSLITYVLQIRDRHNGNILIDTDGHVIHIDFGFMLHNSPGSVGFEQAPFKLSVEYVDILGGRDSAKFAEFRELLLAAFVALRKHVDKVCLLVEMMAKNSPLPCLGGGAATVAALRERFHLPLSEQQLGDLVDAMLVSSCDNITTRMYDAFQYYSNGIL